MSKKKAFSGSTMTLKDFHGGSIPSDLPLPSAPGVVPRPLDRGAFDRPVGGGGFGRQDHHRSRPGSAGSAVARGLEEGSPFLSRIGRNFDEEERKPFYSSSASDEAIRSTHSADPRSQTDQFSSKVFSSSQSQAVSTSFNSGPSPWGVKKEEPVAPHPSAIVGATSKFAQASAIEKITYGRWQSKLATFNQETEVVVSDGGSEFDDEVQPMSTEGRLMVQVYPPLVESVAQISLSSNSGGNMPAERPKLNLLPRSQQPQRSDEILERKREKVFGGARPREVVLKERGVDETSFIPVEQPPLALNREEPRVDSKKEQQPEPGRVDQQWNSRWRRGGGSREPEKPAPSRAEARSWRRPEDPAQAKPVEPPAAIRFGKGASALELAQAFSKPKGGSGRSGTQFSRLAAAPAQAEIYSAAARRRINGY